MDLFALVYQHCDRLCTVFTHVSCNKQANGWVKKHIFASLLLSFYPFVFCILYILNFCILYILSFCIFCISFYPFVFLIFFLLTTGCYSHFMVMNRNPFCERFHQVCEFLWCVAFFVALTPFLSFERFQPYSYSWTNLNTNSKDYCCILHEILQLD